MGLPNEWRYTITLNPKPCILQVSPGMRFDHALHFTRDSSPNHVLRRGFRALCLGFKPKPENLNPKPLNHIYCFS